ncbi:MAG: hypothetical protein PHU85_14815, partial [Phycisphaerae bacterium]|nr:hypothetical protein [Phycisphaerae bacterium]
HYPKEDGPRSNYAKDCTIAPNGDIYWLHERGGYSQPMLCSVLGPDGKEKKSPLITFGDCSAAGVRVDRQGNVYTMNHLKPVGKLVPDALAGKTGTGRQDPYVYKYGSVLKFRPTGGEVKLVAPGAVKKRDVPAGQIQFTTAEGRGDFQAEGVEWTWFGVSNILPNYERDGCHCWAPRFDLDEYGRLFVPDEALNRIVVLDSAGNVVTTFGRYGNVDQPGKLDGIPLGDPRSVAVSDDAAYVGDMSNNCIVRAKLEYYVTASAGATVKGKGADIPKAVAELRDATVKAVPAADKGIDWAAIGRALPANASSPDVSVAVALATRQAKMSDADRTKLLAALAVDESPAIRAVVALANWDRSDTSSIEMLRAALKDKDAMVRVVAADALLTMKNGAGLVEVLKGLANDDANVQRLAQTAFTKKVMDATGEKSLYPIGKAEVAAIAELLAKTSVRGRGEEAVWFMRRTGILLLGQSGSDDAVQPLLDLITFDGSRDGGRRNMCRAIDALGTLRARKAVPTLVEFVARGTVPTDNSNFGDTAEQNAAAALAAIGDPDSVAPLIELLASDKKNTPTLALRTLSQMLAERPLPADRVLLPKDGQLAPQRVDDLPAAAEIQKAWKAFWSDNKAKFTWNPDARELRKK